MKPWNTTTIWVTDDASMEVGVVSEKHPHMFIDIGAFSNVCILDIKTARRFLKAVQEGVKKWEEAEKEEKSHE